MTPQSTVLNDWSDYWFYEIGVNIIPANTREKNTFVGWSEFQDKSIPEQVHEARKKSGHYNNGIALIPGKLWRGPYAEKYLVAIDLDNNKAIEEFCRNNLEKIKQQTIVEQTANPEKMHLYFIVDREIPNKSSDKVDLTKATKIQANEIPALEVKSNGKGLMFCAYSPHKNGSNYQIKGTLKPQVFEAWGIQEQIGIICDKYNIPYGSSNSGNDCAYIGLSIQELFTPGTKILEGHNRHLGILRVMDSLLLKNMGLLTLEQIKELAYQRNQQLCVPPLDNKELDRQWKQALEYANRKKEEREHLAVKKQHLEQNHDQNNNDNENDNDNNNTKTKTLDKQDLIEEATRLLISLHRFLTIEESKDILFYDDEKGVYVKGGEILIEKELEKVFEFRLRTSDITEIKNHIMRRTYVRTEQFDADLDIINLKNGLYNWRTNEFSPHTPDYYSLNQKPIKYNPDAEPKLFLKFLNEVLYQEDITTAKELMAYTFIRKNLFEYYFILIGKGANGKSVFVGILSHLHGLNNISNVPIKSLVKERFALIDLVNKDINVDNELSSASINDMSILKRLTGTQPLRVEQKKQIAFDATIYAKQIINTNEMPNIPDNSDARYRREIVLHFPNQFEGDKEDLHLLNKIVQNEEEMSGIFNLVINSLKTIATRNKIHINATTISQRREKARLTQDPIKAFIEDALAREPTKDDYETSEDLYAAFEKFCNHNQISGPGFDKFSEDLRIKHGLTKDRKIVEKKKRTIWYCKLLKWKDTDDPSQTILGEDSNHELEQHLEQKQKQPQLETSEEKYKREQEEQKKWR